MMSIVSNTRVDIVARGVIKACLELGQGPRRDDRDLPHPGRLGGGGLQDPRQVRHRVLRPLGVHARGGRAGPWRRSREPRHEHPHQRGHDLHRAGHHRARGREPDPRVPGLRLEDRRRRHPRAARAARCTACPCSTRSPRWSSTTAARVPDGSVVTVPPAFTKDAVFEAIEAGIKLIVIVTERIPRRDVAQMVELADQRGARIIGPNCLGLIVPGVAKMGGIGGPAKNTEQAYQPGIVGVMSRSGGMTTEISSTLTAAGLGVSTADLDRRRRHHRLHLRRADAALRGRRADRGDRDLHRARRADGGPARRVGGRERLAPADRGLHGRPVHGRRGDEGHVASATRARSWRARRTRPRRRSRAWRPPASRWWSGSTRSPTPSRRSSERAT